MDHTGSHIKLSEKRKAKRNFRPKASSIFGLDNETAVSLANTMSTQKVPPGGVKTINTGNLTGGVSSRGSSKDEDDERPQMLESKMRNFSPELKKELKQINAKSSSRQKQVG